MGRLEFGQSIIEVSALQNTPLRDIIIGIKFQSSERIGRRSVFSVVTTPSDDSYLLSLVKHSGRIMPRMRLICGIMLWTSFSSTHFLVVVFLYGLECPFSGHTDLDFIVNGTISDKIYCYKVIGPFFYPYVVVICIERQFQATCFSNLNSKRICMGWSMESCSFSTNTSQ